VNIGAHHNFAMVIESTFNGHWLGDVAIDDITFSGCELRSPITNCDTTTQFACADKTQCIDNRYVCDGQVCIFVFSSFIGCFSPYLYSLVLLDVFLHICIL